MKNSKMKNFEEIEVKDLSSLNQTEMGVVKGGIGVTIADGWFDGSLFRRRSLLKGRRINEFDRN